MQWEMVESAYMYRWKRQGRVKKLQDIIKKKGAALVVNCSGDE